MSLEAFANFVNSMGSVVTSRFGQESRCTITVMGQDAFLLRMQGRDGDGTFIYDGTHKIDIANIESIAYKVVSFHEFSTGGPTLYFVNIILMNSIPDTDGGTCRAVGIYAASDEHGKYIKALLEGMAGL